VPADTDSCKIVRRENLLRLLRRDLESRTASYSPVQVNAMAALLQPLTNVSVEQKAQHVDAIKERTEGTICPFCGGELKLRCGKYGSFYGCSNYPKCRYARPVKNG
jgi:hypothetical protein